MVLLAILNAILYKPIRGILNRRYEAENSLKKSIEEFLAQSDRNEKGIEEGKLLARKEGVTEKEAIKGEGLEKQRGILQEASSVAEEKIGNARRDIEAKIVDIRKALEDQLAVFSSELAEKILGRSVQ